MSQAIEVAPRESFSCHPAPEALVNDASHDRDSQARARFPRACQESRPGVFALVVSRSREERAAAYEAMQNGNGGAMIPYYIYSVYELAGGAADQVTMFPERAYDLGRNLVRASGLFGAESKMEATFEQELAGTEVRLFFSEIKERPLDFLESLASAKPFEITGQATVDRLLGNTSGTLSFDSGSGQFGADASWQGGTADLAARIQNPIGLSTAGSAAFGAGPRAMAFKAEFGSSIGGKMSTIAGVVTVAGSLADMSEKQRSQLSKALGMNVGLVKNDSGTYLVLWKVIEEEEKKKSK